MFGSDFLKGIALGAVVVFGASATLAAPVTFNFTGTGITAPVLNYTSGGVNLAVTGNLYTAPETINAAVQVNQSNNGLGVCGTLLASATSGNCGGGPLLDGGSKKSLDDNELLKFSFNKVVNLLSVTFFNNDTNDVFDFFIGEPLDFIVSGNTPTNGQHVYTFGNNFVALSVFGLGVQNASDQVRIQSMTIDYTPAAVPVPAAGLLLLGALGGLAALRRRRTA